MDKLKTLIDFDRKSRGRSPAIDELAFPDMDRDHLFYWSSTPFGTAEAWLVGFDSSGAISKKRNVSMATNAVRLVRSGQ